MAKRYAIALDDHEVLELVESSTLQRRWKAKGHTPKSLTSGN